VRTSRSLRRVDEAASEHTTMRRLRRTATTLARAALALAALALVSRAWADTVAPKLALAWDAPDECPSGTDVEARVARLLADSRRVADAAPVEARVKVTRVREGRWTARLTTRIDGIAGDRTMYAASCDLLASASALVIALAIDPELGVAPPSDAPASSSAPPASSSAPPPVVPPPAPTSSEPPSSPHVIAGAWIAADSGMLPSLAPGAGLLVGLGDRAWSLGAYGEAWLPSTATSDSRPGAGGDFDRVDLGVRGCARLGARFTFGSCLGAELDRAHARGFGVTSPGEATRLWIAARGGAELGLRISDVMFVPLHVDAIVPFSRPTFALENVGAVFRPAPVGVRASLGLTLHFR